MQGIWGSKYMPEITYGDILFIEGSLKDVETIERRFSFLKLNGVFEKNSGIIFENTNFLITWRQAENHMRYC